MLVGDGRRPDATLRAEDGDHSPGPRDREPVGRDDRCEVLRPLEAEQQRLDPGLDLTCVERSGDDVVGAGLQEADPLLDVVACRDAQDRHGGHGRRGADLAAQLEAGPDRAASLLCLLLGVLSLLGFLCPFAGLAGASGTPTSDGELVLDDLRERLVRVRGLR